MQSSQARRTGPMVLANASHAYSYLSSTPTLPAPQPVRTTREPELGSDWRSEEIRACILQVRAPRARVRASSSTCGQGWTAAPAPRGAGRRGTGAAWARGGLSGVLGSGGGAQSARARAAGA